MEALPNDPERHPVPRWRTWRATAQLGGLAPVAVASPVAPPNLRELQRSRRDWETHRTAPFAADFVGAAYALGEDHMGRDAAQFLIRSSGRVPRAALEMARTVLRGQLTDAAEPKHLSREERYRRIRILRKRLVGDPRNPMLWVDLAREYVVLGQAGAARRPLEVALSLAPANRMVSFSSSIERLLSMQPWPLQ